jgi:hypothetical protein
LQKSSLGRLTPAAFGERFPFFAPFSLPSSTTHQRDLMMNRPLFPELFQVAEIAISYHNHTPYQDRIKVPKPSVAYDIFSASWDSDKIELIEQCKIYCLTKAAIASAS